MTQNKTKLTAKIALYQPDIPQNTASIIRTCSCFSLLTRPSVTRQPATWKKLEKLLSLNSKIEIQNWEKSGHNIHRDFPKEFTEKLIDYIENE